MGTACFGDKGGWELGVSINYCQLNWRMNAQRLCLPNMEEILKDLEGCSIFTKMVLFYGYWKIAVPDLSSTELWWSLFHVTLEHFGSKSCPIWLMSAHATLQKINNEVWKGLPYARMYLYDFVKFSNELASSVTEVETVWKPIYEARIWLKLRKCRYPHYKVQLLRHIVSRERTSVDP